MNESVKKILEILSEYEGKKQQEVFVECASKIGTKEWQDAIEDLMKRLGMK